MDFQSSCIITVQALPRIPHLTWPWVVGGRRLGMLWCQRPGRAGVHVSVVIVLSWTGRGISHRPAAGAAGEAMGRATGAHGLEVLTRVRTWQNIVQSEGMRVKPEQHNPLMISCGLRHKVSSTQRAGQRANRRNPAGPGTPFLKG